MTAQEQNTDLVKLLSVYFVENDNPAYAWGQACAGILALPALRAFWPMSSVDYATASQARDVAGGAYHLSNNNSTLFGYDQLAPYAEFDGTNQYLNRADGGAGNWADITGTEAYVPAAQRGLTLGGWFYFDAIPAATRFIIGKYNFATNNRSFALYQINTGALRFVVSVDGTATVLIDSTDVLTALGWTFIVGRYVPSTSLTSWINTSTYTQAAGVPASLFDGTATFSMGAFSNPGSFLDGKASLCWLCAAALSDSQIGVIYQQTRRLFQRT